MRSFYRAALAAWIICGSAACDAGDVPDGILFVDPEPIELAGVWTGVEEITTQGDVSARVGDPNDEGFSFPVALVLRVDRTFTIRSFNYPIEGNGEANEFCAGIFTAEGRTIAFFPNRDCPALPLSRYTIGRFLPDGMILQAETGTAAGGSAGAEAANVKVRIRVERD